MGKWMNPRDISDVTGSTYTFLINGHGPQDDLQLAFQPGSACACVINGSAMTFFNVRILGVPMTVIQADGQMWMAQVDEFQIGVAETYDVIVSPPDGSHAIVPKRWIAVMGVASLRATRATVPLHRRCAKSHDDGRYGHDGTFRHGRER